MDDPTANKALKAAKKSLKKQDFPSMKLKDLAKLVADQLGDETSHKKIKKWISKSDVFSVQGKEVSLSKKRSADEDPKKENDPIPSKKARKDKRTSPSQGEVPLSSVENWRTKNKIVIMHARDDEEGKKETKIISNDSVYFPFVSFEECKSLFDESMIRQCTEANGFKTPSPIQAQAWPILMHKKDGLQRRDMVGIGMSSPYRST